MTEVILLDGGMGQELIKRSNQPPHALWSAKVLHDEPEIVEAVHCEYILAGSTIITLNNYSLTPERLKRDGASEFFIPLQEKAKEIAISSIEKTSSSVNHSVKIAGCLPPLIASYRPDLAPSLNECVDSYNVIAEAQKDVADLFICETMSSIKEAKAAILSGKETNLPIWVSFTIQDNLESKLRSGESLKEAIESIKDLGVSAILINCSIPEAIDSAFDTLHSNFKSVGAYANGFTSVDSLEPGGTVDTLQTRKDLDPKNYTNFALGWIESGAKIIGGCCEVGPDHISHLSDSIIKAGYNISDKIQ